MPLLCLDLKNWGISSDPNRRRSRRLMGQRQRDQVFRVPQRRGVHTRWCFGQRYLRDRNRTQQRQRILRAIMRRRRRLPLRVRIHDNRAGAGTQHHLADRVIYSTRGRDPLPGHNHQQRQHNGQGFCQNRSHPGQDIGQSETALQAPKGRAQKADFSSPVRAV